MSWFGKDVTWTKARLQKIAAEIHAAFVPVHEATMAYAVNHSPENLQKYRDALERFYARPFAEFYWFESPDFLAAIKSGDVSALEDGILFLEVDPFCFRSGYIKRKIGSALKKPRLAAQQKKRLRRVILNLVYSPYPADFYCFARLSRKLYAREFLDDVNAIKSSGREFVEKRKLQLLRQLTEAAVRGNV